jgi:predicted nucleotidyltransferase
VHTTTSRSAWSCARRSGSGVSHCTSGQKQVVLFGSYAWGTPDADSDLDLYVVVPDRAEPTYRLARRAYRALHGVGTPVDVVVRTHGESQRKAGVVSTLDHEILTRGLVLYG